jgi:hypothetical protein
MRIIVESVTGTARFSRNDKWQRITRDSILIHGDGVVVDVGGVLKLEFQSAARGTVLAAVVLRGFTRLTVTEAYERGEQPVTQLDVPQGTLRAGVVRTAVPPSFRVRTPRSVVAVRGTEIAELEISGDLGDRLRMGRIGTVVVHDLRNQFRSASAEQLVLRRETGYRPADTLVRAIENANLETRALLPEQFRSTTEIRREREVLDVTDLREPPSSTNGAPTRDREINTSRPVRVTNPCPIRCEDESHSTAFHAGLRRRRG